MMRNIRAFKRRMARWALMSAAFAGGRERRWAAAEAKRRRRVVREERRRLTHPLDGWRARMLQRLVLPTMEEARRELQTTKDPARRAALKRYLHADTYSAEPAFLRRLLEGRS